ncbi:chorismate transformation enzyme, FkbO/Hyg5 family [Marinicella gelatinilytica]|uniref:chorismate transformation enzyme, FkbO/Hyg5 family n=1 Tax=Marinicella gelatinilytica TaxID=2996017 RepID=UPI002260A57B|nr:hypothetical protein [Marinicella gelatinilytica]MCX7544397.1 hypothetical protein [Marinicella gelatinilytica]
MPKVEQLHVNSAIKANNLVRFTYLNQPQGDDLTVVLPFEVLAQSNGYQEIWQDGGQTTEIIRQDNRLSIKSEFFLVLIYTSESPHLDDVVSDVYNDALQSSQDKDYPHLIRVWNFFPAINDDMGGMENYQRFCVARHALLDQHNQLGQPNPAATAIGTHNHKSTYVFVFSKTSGKVIENNRQVSAWEYPLHYSPKQPRFSRALQFGDLLMCSGTASVVGHETKHKDDLLLQFKECMANINVLLTASDIDVPLEGGLFRFYLRDSADLNSLQQYIAQAGLRQFVILGGDICREDLLVECEAVFQNN